MKREFLRNLFKDLNLEQSVVDDLVDKIAEENGKDLESVRKPDLSNYVSKDDYNAKVKEFEDFKSTNKEAIEKYSTLQNEYNTLKENSTKELDDFKLAQFVEKELAGKKVRNATAMKAILKEKGFEFKLNEKKDGIDKEAFDKAFDEAIKGNEYLLDTSSSASKSGYEPGMFGTGSSSNQSKGNVPEEFKDFLKL